MALTKIDDRGLKTPIDLLDNEKIQLGSSQDLQIFHDGSHSIIRDTGTGSLMLQGSSVIMESADGGEVLAKFIDDGAVELYYDNSKKLETNSNGIKVTGSTYHQVDGQGVLMGASNDFFLYHDGSNSHINNDTGQIRTNSDWRWADDKRIKLGTGDDLQLWHNGTNSNLRNFTGDMNFTTTTNEIHNVQTSFQVKPKGGDEDGLKVITDGAVELYYDDTLKFGTDSAGIYARGDLMLNYADNYKIKLGAGNDLQIYHNGSHSIIDNNTGILYLQSDQLNINNSASDEGLAKFYANGAVKLNYDTVLRFETTSYGNSVHGHFDIAGDNEKLRLGGSYDLELWHDGTSNYISATGGASTNVRAKNLYFYVNANTSSEKAIMCYQNAATDLYYDDSKKLETTSSGVNVIGALTVDGAAIGGGAWEVIATHVLGSADNFSSTGWNTNYQNYKMVFTDVNNGSTGTNFGLQVYLDTSPTSTGTGTLETADNSYQYAFRIDTGTYGSNGEAEYHYLRGGASRSWWSGELTFPMHANTTSHKKTWYGHYGADEEYYSERCYMNNDPEKFIKGVRVYFDCGASGMGGRITFLRQKYS